ncbi:MAG: bifunctional riboflavin kinase/FAD synthetase [Actinobacteria bacterium]|nr:bifunctional riboflavin kinase/FAD synthetase [Actinomycetota bacterium]
MKTFYGIETLQPPPDGCVITIGTFDGVHLGHRVLISRTIAEADARRASSAVVTWDRHPAATLRPEKMPALLCSPERKIELLAERGQDILAVLPFDEELSQWPAGRFVEEVLVTGLAARLVVVGEDWRFGKGASGDVELLAEMGSSLGFDVVGMTLERSGDETVSSSRIRKLIASGDLDAAAELLGRRFDLDGVVVHGDDRGKSLGFPTANVALPPGLAHPPRGVYAGRARVGGDATMLPPEDGDLAPRGWYPAAVNIGVNPTFGGDPDVHPARVEAYLLGLDVDIYGAELRVELWSRLRDEKKFDSAHDLIQQMQKDVEETRRIVEEVEG